MELYKPQHFIIFFDFFMYHTLPIFLLFSRKVEKDPEIISSKAATKAAVLSGPEGVFRP